MLSLRSEDMSRMMGQHEDWFSRHGVPSETFPTNRITPADRRRFRNTTVPDNVLEGNETISTGKFDLELFWTPGHSPGHICLYERKNKILFTGDHVLPGITPNISLQPHIGGNPLGDFLGSLAVLRTLDVDTALPAHENIFNDLKGRIDGITRHHHFRYSEIIEAINSGARTAYEISHGITWLPDFGGIPFMELTPWTRRMAVSETLAHLKAMEVEGIIQEVSDNGMVHFRNIKQPHAG
jgi:glyoxylase-like metal-dependent hydrolase (beta-lactamase superfamily II)